MPKSNKITIRITPGRRSETITWSGAGTFGSLTLSQVNGQLTNEPLTSAATGALYFQQVLNLVSAAL